MEKVSGVLPTNERISSVDMTEAHPIRKGVPTFGRPVSGEVADRVSISGKSPEDAPMTAATYKKNKDAKDVKIVDDITRKFFAGNTRAAMAERTADAERMAALDARGGIETEGEAEEESQLKSEASPLASAMSSRSMPESSREHIR